MGNSREGARRRAHLGNLGNYTRQTYELTAETPCLGPRHSNFPQMTGALLLAAGGQGNNANNLSQLSRPYEESMQMTQDT